MSILDPRLWLAIVLALAGTAFVSYHKGARDEKASQIRQAAVQAAEARETEQELKRMENRATTVYIDRIIKQQEKARALPVIKIVHDCTVPADVGRVLNDAQRLPGDAGAGSGTGHAGAAVDSTCAAELDIAKRNYADVCIPNAEQLTELQDRWEKTRQLVNKGRQ